MSIYFGWVVLGLIFVVSNFLFRYVYRMVIDRKLYSGYAFFIGLLGISQPSFFFAAVVRRGWIHDPDGFLMLAVSVLVAWVFYKIFQLMKLT